MNLFNAILRDNLSGSGTILREVQKEMATLGQNTEIIQNVDLQKAMEELLRHFPQFGLLHHFAGAFREHFKTAGTIRGKELDNFVDAYREKWKDARDHACRNIIENVDFSGKNVLVHSNSSAIHQLFTLLSQNKIFPVVWQTFSSPVGEGRVQAEVISSLGFETHLIHEDTLSNFSDQLDMVVFGADMILEDRFLNKAGTFPISLLFQHFGKPVYVLAEQRKKITEPAWLENGTIEKEKPAEELTPDHIKGIRVHNLYFEFTPLSLVKNVFLDE